MRFALLIIALLSSPAPAALSDAQAALADRQQFPQEKWPYLYYLSTTAVDPKWSWEPTAALSVVIPSMTPLQPILERSVPVQVTETLSRIDIQDLGWDWHAWADLIAKNPYSTNPNSIVIRADWLLLALTDAHDSDAYYRLVFGGANGGKAPKTRDEALQILGVNNDVKLQFGLIEGKSGVSVQGVRLIRNLSAARGYAWGTQDVLKLVANKDPLEQPEGDFDHDGEEWIIGIRKIHLATGTQGALQVYFLANGQGKIVDRAPVDLVADHTHFRGLDEIRVAGSCIQCHASGMNMPTRNELRETVKSGVRVLAYYDDQQALEQFHFADVTKELFRNRDDFSSIVRLACGGDSSEAVQSYQAAIDLYDQALDLQAAAREIGASPNELKLALGYASAGGYRLGARLSSLDHGGTVPRDSWEGSYLTVKALYEQWEQNR